MRVRVSYRVNISDEIRRAIRRFYGQEGMADRNEVMEFYRQHGGTMDDDLRATHGDPEGFQAERTIVKRKCRKCGVEGHRITTCKVVVDVPDGFA